MSEISKDKRGMDSFVHLHLHSEYSLLDGACRISRIPQKAREMGHTAAALTDHGVMYGAVAFYRACKKEGIKPIIGCEVYTAQRTMDDRDHERDSKSNHLVLLVKNEIGYKNLIYMVSEAFTRGFYSKPRIDIDLLRDHSEGLIALSACLAGYIPRKIVSGEFDEAKRYAVMLEEIFGKGNFFLEVQDHGISDQRTVNEGILQISRETGIPMAATNDVHYLEKQDAQVQNVLLSIQTNTKITDPNPIRFETEEFYYKSTEEMEKLFSQYEGAVENTAKISEMCNFEFTFDKTYLPRYRPQDNSTPAEYLRSLAYRGLSERAEKGHISFSPEHPREEYEKRIEYELGVIDSMGYSEYYLIVWDFVHYSKSHGITVGPGRGSGAGSLVAFLVGIVDVNPIEYDLLFERFLNPERVSMPDFDIDFSDDKRDMAIEYVREKYGKDHTAQIITFGTMAARAAVRDVGRALGMSYSDVDEVASKIPRENDITLQKAMEIPALRDMYDSDSEVRRLIDIAMRLEGMPRHASTHAAGVVITDRPVYEYVPLAVNGDIPVTQFTMETVADLGLLKFDFLALRYLTIIDACTRQIHEKNPEFDISAIDMRDKSTYAMMQRGETDGVFQLESGGMKQLITRMKPDRIDDIIASIALYRPGPMDSIPKYLSNREHPSEIKYTTNLLAPILKSTHGCIVYQEQVMQIFRSVAGYSLGKADIVRRAISKKKAHVLEAERENFIIGAGEHGVPEDAATQLFEDIASFANYAFNKGHAAAYAILCYRTAYLKCHYLREYLSALLTSVMDSPAKIAEYIGAAKSRGITVLLPDVNESFADFHVSEGRIRFGLLAIKNIGRNTVEEIIKSRNEDGKFTDLASFLCRIDPGVLNKRQLEALVKSGALDCLGEKRSAILCALDALCDSRIQTSSHAIEGQLDLFMQADEASMMLPTLPDIEEFSQRELLALEKESIGIYLSGHILSDYSENISHIPHEKISVLYSSEEDNSPPEGGQITVCAVVCKTTVKRTKNGDRMAFVTVEDETGECELVVFPKLFERYEYLFVQDSAICVFGKINTREDENPKIILEKASELQNNSSYTPKVHLPEKKEAQPNSPKRLFLRLDMSDEHLVRRITSLVSIFEGEDFVIFYDSSKKEYAKDRTMRTQASPFLIKELVSLLGDGSVVEK